ncbi:MULTISPECIES: Flp family type IVb pilin [Comamonas]|jgi:pilus assembly protein Flp/PilA|uniref:Flp family type IVb pilin n=1 Tax=Comamonas TaxID=283 RepID=UPI00050DCFD8|nr:MULTISPECIES: Flp family type IVb pilin [Comamonas]KGG91872.1 pilus subunit protein PilA [Comamonas thiooxydans]KGG95379.1 pilus subunit protein PilA [Comamonas thiooxydans]KGH07951.1 pilus subunit protein PilA [Comamonas thiooxydans]KGH15480.1 pilus subunit protein PilA [Comamonas thiooxydans]TZG07219.1 Flp family type IVb pilin [Comamonas thiooxydans]
MNKIAQQFGHSLQSFVRDEEGAQIIEYALIVAVVSLGLILLMMGTGGLDFAGWIERVNACLGGNCAAPAAP